MGARIHRFAVGLGAALILATTGAFAWAGRDVEGPSAATSAKVSKQIQQLKRRTKALEARNTANPAGAAGGDLAGTYPDPQIRPQAVTTDKLGLSSVLSSELGPVTYRLGTPVMVDGGDRELASAECNPGEQLLSGIAGFYDDLTDSDPQIVADLTLFGDYSAYGLNQNDPPKELTAIAVCLAP